MTLAMSKSQPRCFGDSPPAGAAALSPAPGRGAGALPAGSDGVCAGTGADGDGPGPLIWGWGTWTPGGISLLSGPPGVLPPLGRLMGLDSGMLAFSAGLSANEIVLPILLMGYLHTGTLTECSGLEAPGPFFCTAAGPGRRPCV